MGAYSMFDIIALITARGGSKTIPRKNIKMLAGKPLIAWTIEAALQSKSFSRVIVSTDDNEIAQISRKWGAEVPFMRPPSLAQDDSSHISVILHAMEWLSRNGVHPDYLMLLQPTSPLRTADDILSSIQIIKEKNARAVVGVCETPHHPNLSKRVLEDGTLDDFISSDISYLRRQVLSPAYVVNGAIYLSEWDSLIKEKTLIPDSTYPYVMSPERSLDIDSPWQFYLTECMLRKNMKQRTIDIADRRVGEGESCYIIAEAGVNHNGDVELAKSLIDVAIEARVDAVKFQTWVTEKVMVPNARMAEYQVANTGCERSQFEMAKELELSYEQFQEIKQYADERGIQFLSTPDEEDSADFLDNLGIPIFKIGSGEVTNHAFLRHVALKGKPIILSTGMSTMGEVEAAVRVIEEAGNKKLMLLHCVSEYPANPAECNLKAMSTLRSAFGYPVGFSDHTLGCDVAVFAVSLGACIIEKHFTLDTRMKGPDHCASLNPAELADFVKAVRTVESAKGDGVKRPSDSEIKNKIVVQKCLVVSRDIKAGETITKDDIVLRRASSGLLPVYLAQVLNKRAKCDIAALSALTMDVLD